MTADAAPTARTEAVHRLVYGPAPYAGHDGIIVDAEAATRLGRAATATTLGEYVATFLESSWDAYVAAEYDGAEAPSPDDVFDYAEWFDEVIEFPADRACDIAAQRVAEIAASQRPALSGIRSGGGSPGGNMDAITGPLEQLALLASLVVPERDGFTLERDDALVDLGMSRTLYAAEGKPPE